LDAEPKRAPALITCALFAAGPNLYRLWQLLGVQSCLKCTLLCLNECTRQANAAANEFLGKSCLSPKANKRNKRAAPKRLGPYAGIALQLAMAAHVGPSANVLARTDWQPAPTEYTPAVTYRKVVRDNMTWLPVITRQWLSCSVLADCITCDPAKPLGFSWGCQRCRDADWLYRLQRNGRHAIRLFLL
jgi:hypothetical protein